MDAEVIKNAIGSLELIINEARDALRQIAAEEFHHEYLSDSGSWDNPRGALGAVLERTYDILLVVLEAGQLPLARKLLVEAWPRFKAERGSLSRTEEDPEYESSSSPALTYVERLTTALRMTVTEETTTQDAWTLTRLEAMLRDTAVILKRNNVVPKNEMDVQRIMGDYLEVCFPSFRKNPFIGGAMKNFKPDFGIADVGAAIEFKIAHTQEQVPVAFSGIVEDTAGYKGSKDWTRFYVVVYQAGPFTLSHQFAHDMKRVGAVRWTPILVNSETRGRRSVKAGAKGKPKKTVRS